MNLAIFGAGAISSYLVARLAASSFPVTLISRVKTAAKIAKSGLCIEKDETPILRVFLRQKKKGLSSLRRRGRDNRE
jgi:ketopantoate reductase